MTTAPAKTTLYARYKFFKENGGGIVGEQAKSALLLARAEEWLHSHDELDVIWQYDDDADGGPSDWGWSAKDVEKWDKTEHEVEWCHITDGNDVLASLSGIWDATREYRRVVEAELALDAMDLYEATPESLESL